MKSINNDIEKKENNMKKKKYLTPTVRVIKVANESHLLNWSAPKDTGGGNTPEAKAYNDFTDDDDPFATGLGSQDIHDIWDDENKE